MPRTFVWHRTRGPHVTPKEEAPTNGKIRIEQVRSGIGKPAVMRRTLVAMGLRIKFAEKFMTAGFRVLVWPVQPHWLL